MKHNKYVSRMLIVFLLIIGCSGNYGKLKSQSEGNSKATQQELIDNWSDYKISLDYRETSELTVIVFDPKNDHRKILLGTKWVTVEEQETWTEIVKANTTSDGDFNLNGAYLGTTGVKEIYGPDNQLYGFIIHLNFAVQWVNVKMVDENTIQLSWEGTYNNWIYGNLTKNLSS